MKTLRFALPLLALAGLLSSGCVLTSAQIMATYELPNPFTILSPTSIGHVYVDLNTVSDYADNKDKLKDIVDLALLGRFKNLGPAATVTVYMTPGATSYTDAASVIADPTAVKVWGPLSLPAAPSTTSITWNASAKLFGAGRAALVKEIKGDGAFTLYAIGGSGTYSFEVQGGALVMVLDGGL